MAKVDYVIFTDGSVVMDHVTGRTYSGYAVVILNTKTLQYATMGSAMHDRTVNYCESYAIYRGLDKVLRMRRDRIDVLVVTDSQMSIEAITRYMRGIWDTSDPKNWKKVDGQPVRNQALYKKIKKLIDDNKQMRLHIIHIKSHKDIDRAWPYMQERFAKHGVNTTEEAAKMFMAMNALADRIAYNKTREERDYERGHGKFYRLKYKE